MKLNDVRLLVRVIFWNFNGPIYSKSLLLFAWVCFVWRLFLCLLLLALRPPYHPTRRVFTFAYYHIYSLKEAGYLSVCLYQEISFTAKSIWFFNFFKVKLCKGPGKVNHNFWKRSRPWKKNHHTKYFQFEKT